MCLVAFAHNYHPSYKFILIANRDEFYARPTQNAHFWDENRNIIGGKDLEAGGMWLGIHKEGKIACITNYRDIQNLRTNTPSRGELTLHFLEGNSTASSYLEDLQPKAQEYNGFNLLLADINGLYYFSNYQNKIKPLDNGLYGLSNHLLDTPWYKVQRIKDKFKQYIDLNPDQLDPQVLLQILHDPLQPEKDEDIQQTGLDMDRERMLSPMFIESPTYGTCASSVILWNHQNHITFVERSYNTVDRKPVTQVFDLDFRV